MKSSFVVVLFVGSYAFAEDFSIYPLTPAPLEFSTQLELAPALQSVEGHALEFPPVTPSPTLELFSMQYVYPDETTLYSMQVVEPDPATKFSMYTPEDAERIEPALPEFELLPE
jgi:hypothetical protein